MAMTENSSSASQPEEPPEKPGGQVKPLRLSLNPNAQEFVPSSSKSTTVTELNSTNPDRSSANLDRNNSAKSAASDDEYTQYWRSQLPDDLISDMDFLDLASEPNQYDQGAREFNNGGARISTTRNGEQSQRTNAKNGVDGGDDEVHPLHHLAAEFPNFAVESLGEVYYANGCDLQLTVEMLTQLELQEEGAPSRRTPRPTVAAPSLTPLDFPSLPGVDLIPENRPIQRPLDVRTSLARRFGPGEQGVDFAAVVRKQVAQQPPQWHYERNGGDVSLGSGRSSVQIGGYGYGSRETHRIAAPQPQPWLETGEAVAHMYSDMREEARDHARVRNAYFEQARQAYLIGNKALAKELSAKGQWHNEQMKVAHSKAAETIFQQRNSSLVHVTRDGQGRMIDLHGLHVSEAIPVLKRELSSMKMTSRATSKRQCVYVCVGTGHHTKGSRTPARVPIAIERYLAEEERLQFTEVQPGMLRVIV